MIAPDWPLNDKVGALSTTRIGGVSASPFDSLNLGLHVGDEQANVLTNRSRLHAHLPNPPVWLEQVHGEQVIEVDHDFNVSELRQGDALYSRLPNQPLAIMTADCLAILIADENGKEVAAIHAGWRGIANNLIANTLDLFQSPRSSLIAWFGPAIGPKAFQVGEDVKRAFCSQTPSFSEAFQADEEAGKYLADIYRLAQIRLKELGVTKIYGGGLCTYDDPARFFSYRRDGRTGRMATLIWRR